MKNYLHIPLLLLLPFWGVAQQPNPKEPTPKEKNSFNHQFDLDVYYLGVEASRKKRISKKMLVGFGVGVLKIKPFLDMSDALVEFLIFRPFIDFQLNAIFHLETGLTYAPFVLVSGDDFYGSSTIGLEIGAFLKVWKLELGVRPALTFYGENSRGDFGMPKLNTTLLIIKIPLKRWK